MSFDLKKNLKVYMTQFDNSFIGFFDMIAEIMNELGAEWKEYGKKEWGEAFISSAAEIKKISEKMAKLKVDFEDKRDNATVKDVVQDYQEKLKAILNKKPNETK